MAAQKGSDIILKIGDGASPSSFTAIGGLRTKSIRLDAESVDVSDSDSPQKMRELLAGAGMKSISISGSGVFKDSNGENLARTEFHNQTIREWQLVLPGLVTYQGSFQLTQLEYGGDHNGEVTFTLTLESAGNIAAN